MAIIITAENNDIKRFMTSVIFILLLMMDFHLFDMYDCDVNKDYMRWNWFHKPNLFVFFRYVNKHKFDLKRNFRNWKINTPKEDRSCNAY